MILSNYFKIMDMLIMLIINATVSNEVILGLFWPIVSFLKISPDIGAFILCVSSTILDQNSLLS